MVAGQPAPGLLYSQVLPVRTDVIGSSFALWVGRNDKLFWESADARGANFTVLGLMLSPLRGPAGNIEFLAQLRPGSHDGPDDAALVATQVA